jgi:hypothetical protein
MKVNERDTVSRDKQLHRAHGSFAANQTSEFLCPAEFVGYEHVDTATTVWLQLSDNDCLDAGLADRNSFSNLSVDWRNTDDVE